MCTFRGTTACHWGSNLKVTILNLAGVNKDALSYLKGTYCITILKY